jgi:hypothetical protein
METKKVIYVGVIGARVRNTVRDKHLIRKVLIHRLVMGDNMHLISGGCHVGGDRFAEELAVELNLPITVYKPDCPKGSSKFDYGKACFRRNTTIAEKSDIIVATPRTDKNGEPFGGTGDTIRKAKKLGKPIVML